MRLLWHIIQKDARRVRWALALWIVVMGARFALGAWMLRAPHLDAPAWQQLSTYDDCLWFAQMLLACLLAGWIVQEDLLAGTQAFWLARPISRRRLLGAKLLGVGLLVCVLPVVVALPWWLSCGYGAREVAAAATETVFWHACLVSVAVALASLTDDMGRFVLYGLTLALVAGTYAIFLFAVKLKWIEAWLQGLQSGVLETRVWVCAVWVLLVGGVTAAHQYLTRRTWASWLVLAVGLAAIVGPVQFWPWNMSGWARARPAPAAPVAGLSTELMAARLKSWGVLPNGEDRLILGLMLRFRGIPDHDVLDNLKVKNTWLWPDGERYLRWPDWMPDEVGQYVVSVPLLGLRDELRWDYASRRAVLDYFRWHPRPGASGIQWTDSPAGSWLYSLSLPAAIGAKMRAQPPAWEAQIEGELAQARVAVQMPLRLGATGGRGREGVRLVAINLEGSKAAALSVTQAWSTAGTLRVFDVAVVSYREAEAPGYVVFSQDKSRLADVWPSGLVAHRIGTVAIVRRSLMIHAPERSERTNGSPWRRVVDPEWPGWLGHATLARVVRDQLTHFELTLHADRFEVEPASPSPPAAP